MALRWLMAFAGLLASIASVWLVATGGGDLNALEAALGAALAAALATTAATTAWPQPSETLIAAVVIGLFARAADPALAPWSIPADLRDLGSLTRWTCAALTLIYLVAFLGALQRRRRPLSVAGSVAFLAVPFLFNLLLALNNVGLMGRLGSYLGAAAKAAPWLGRGVTLWVLNAVVVAGTAWMIDGRGIRSARLHGTLLLAAAAAVVAPLIADFGSSRMVAGGWPPVQALAVLASAGAAQAGLWAEVFLLTGVLLRGLRGRRPTPGTCWDQWIYGLVRGAIFGALYLLLTQVAVAGAQWEWLVRQLQRHPAAAGAVLGALLFPLACTLMESFDGSAPFHARLRRAYLDPMNAIRGALTGAALVLAIDGGLAGWNGGPRFLAGFGIGALGYGGADVLRDLAAVALARRQRLQTPRLYVLGLLLGGFVGGALAWYFDAAQLGVVTAEIRQYAQVSVSAGGGAPTPYVIYPLFSKWGAIDLGNVGGGVRLFWSQSMAGVVNWAIAAPLFGVNLILLTALVKRSFAPLRELFTRQGLVAVFAQTIRVLRWGPWMAPIIFTFLRLAPEPTWYNQDGLVRTLVSIGQDVALPHCGFQLWSLQVFLALLAYDGLRILIWFDHMGLRVATLVNLSFVGADALDERAAHALGHSARSRVIPEAIRRFFTWAPLLIPFYLPRGTDWDYVWNGAEALGNHPGTPLLPAVTALLWGYGIVASASVVLIAALLILRHRAGLHTPPRAPPPFAYRLGNGQYTLDLHPDGSGYSHVASALRPGFEIDLTRCPDDPLQRRGKWFWLREVRDDVPQGAAWSLTALPSGDPGVRYRVCQRRASRVRFEAERDDVHAAAEVEVDVGQNLERWTLRLTSTADRPRAFEITSYRELAMAAGDDYRRAPAYAALHVGTSFHRRLGALFARNRLLTGRNGRISTEAMFHAVDADGGAVRLLGYEDSRSAFVGAGTVSAAAVFAGRALRRPDDEGRLFTFDPIASLRVQVEVPARGSAEVHFVDGYAEDEDSALRLVARAFGRAVPEGRAPQAASARHRRLRSSAGPLAPDVYSEDGLEVRAAAEAERPWKHVLANGLEHGAVVGADGGIASFHKNAQQYALTPFDGEELPSQTPGQLLAVVDLDSGERLNAAFVPWRRADVIREVVFGLGYVGFRARYPDLELEETVVVPPDAPLVLHRLRVRNTGAGARRLRAVAYAEMVLAETARDSIGRIAVQRDADPAVLYFRNPENDFCRGWAFAATNLPNPTCETLRAAFLGPAHAPGEAFFLHMGRGDRRARDDGRRCAAFAGRMDVPPGEERCINFLIGQATDRAAGCDWVRRYRDATGEEVRSATRAWWQRYLGALEVRTDHPALDRLVNTWLPYQVYCARLWARCGPQQRSGAFGFRDQLQDVLPLMVTHPAVARRQILLHAAQQFRAGDVLSWWHVSWEGRTGLGARSLASDPPLWLPYVAARYVHDTGDGSILNEEMAFLEGHRVPKGEAGLLLGARRSRDRATLYAHCLRAIDHTLTRLSPRGLPLIGSGDWNDGFDALGRRGRGESVWLGFFLYRVLRDFGRLAAGKGDASAVQRYEAAAVRLRSALDSVWRGDGYVRATSDDGRELRLPDCLMAAWPTLSGAVPDERARMALESALSALERDTRVLLLAPPFDESASPYPGRIARYPPGARENGGQYSHGASWTVDAWLAHAGRAAECGDSLGAAHCRDRAWQLWWKISPLSKDYPGYGLPPHQQPADVYSGPGAAGRGGWAWYTGAAGRMLEAAYALLGLEMEGGELRLRPMPAGGAAPRLRRIRWRGREMQAPDSADRRQ